MPITAGQECTVATGIKANIIKISVDDPFLATIDPKYSDLRTYNDAKDAKEGRSKTICTEISKTNTADAFAVPHCTIEHGVGMNRKPTSDIKNQSCIAYGCPPGWKQTGLYCEKPKADAIVDVKSRCDEQWSDWFMIPNYHLGNKYSSNSNTCYSPCPDNHVPLYATDPVDAARIDLTSSDAMDQCASRQDYFYGKYANGTDYCPLAWIHRINSTIPNVEHHLKGMYADFGLKVGSSNTLITPAFSDLTNETAIKKSAEKLSTLVTTYRDNVTTPDEAMQIACNKLNTVERLNAAYTVCSNVLTKPDDYDEKTQAILKQACNAVFCNEADSSLNIINKAPICFVSPKDVEFVDPDTIPDPDAPTADKEQTYVLFSLKAAVFTVFACILCVLLYLAWLKVSPIFRIMWDEIRIRLDWTTRAIVNGKRSKAQFVYELAKIKNHK